MYDPILMFISIAFAGIGMLASFVLKSKFQTYSNDPLDSGLSGRDIAEKMLHDNGVYDVSITCVGGMLTDHYNPANKTVNLSSDVYQGRNTAAAAVAAHECGHAIQHARAYPWLQFRSSMVPVVNISSQVMNMLVYAFAFGAFFAPRMGNTFLLLYIVCQAVVTLFAIATLPVEVDASRRALVWLDGADVTMGAQQARAKDALTWAAYTYFINALAAIATLVYLIMQLNSRRD
jgi:uncharacterized protein